MDPEVLFNQAMGLMNDGEITKARELLNQIVDEYPDWKTSDKALAELKKISKYSPKQSLRSKYLRLNDAVMPDASLSKMVVASLIVGFFIHAGLVGKPYGEALAGAFGMAIVIIPVSYLLALIPATIYWLVTKKSMRGKSFVAWFVWVGYYGLLMKDIMDAIATKPNF